MRTISRVDYLARHDTLATIGLRRRGPFRFSVRVFEDAIAPMAFTTGIFHVTLHLNRYRLNRASTAVRVFAIDHELAHMNGRHPFILMLLTVLFPPLYLLARPMVEWLADRRAVACLSDDQALHAMRVLAPRGFWGRLFYGRTPETRLERAKWPSRKTRLT